MNLVFSWLLMVKSWSPLGLFMVSSWSVHGLFLLFMVCSWSPFDLFMVSSWSLHGLFMILLVSSWSPLGLFMVSSWSLHGLLLVSSWSHGLVWRIFIDTECSRYKTFRICTSFFRTRKKPVTRGKHKKCAVKVYALSYFQKLSAEVVICLSTSFTLKYTAKHCPKWE